jgi:hypothetical protein
LIFLPEKKIKKKRRERVKSIRLSFFLKPNKYAVNTSGECFFESKNYSFYYLIARHVETSRRDGMNLA